MATRVRTGEVTVVGLTELNRALRAMGPGLQRELKDVNRTVAELVAADARAIASSVGGVAAKVAPSIVAKGYQTAAAVGFGGAAYPMAGGAEFGSIRYKQFKPWTGNGSDAGYFVYPAIRQDLDRIETEYATAIDALKERLDL